MLDILHLPRFEVEEEWVVAGTAGGSPQLGVSSGNSLVRMTVEGWFGWSCPARSSPRGHGVAEAIAIFEAL